MTKDLKGTCEICGKKIDVTQPMCDDCYWWLREGMQ